MTLCYSEYFVTEAQRKEPTFELVGSWRVLVGDEDQVVNLWRHQNGYRKASQVQAIISSDATCGKLLKEQRSFLRSRHNQFMMAFSFWGHPVPIDRASNYEMRSYVLKPGTMIEWGNNWWVVWILLLAFSSICLVSIVFSLFSGHEALTSDQIKLLDSSLKLASYTWCIISGITKICNLEKMFVKIHGPNRDGMKSLHTPVRHSRFLYRYISHILSVSHISRLPLYTHTLLSALFSLRRWFINLSLFILVDYSTINPWNEVQMDGTQFFFAYQVIHRDNSAQSRKSIVTAESIRNMMINRLVCN